MNVKIYYAHTESLMKQHSLNELLEYIHASQRARAIRYKSNLSAYNYIVGRLLLKHGLKDFNLDTDLEKIVIQENGKPGLPSIYFNISHSGHQVSCAFSKQGKLGLDIEEIKPILFDDFTAMFSSKEWKSIKNAKNPLQAFYWFWTRKESIIKANGLKLGDLHKIELDVSSNFIISQSKRWCLKELNFGDGYMGAICTEKDIENFTIEQLTTTQLFMD